MTREALAKLTDVQRRQIEFMREDYKLYKKDGNRSLADGKRKMCTGYLHGLCDAGVITDRERMEIFSYFTV